jgi:hypothetical protein
MDVDSVHDENSDTETLIDSDLEDLDPSVDSTRTPFEEGIEFNENGFQVGDTVRVARRNIPGK